MNDRDRVNHLVPRFICTPSVAPEREAMEAFKEESDIEIVEKEEKKGDVN